MRSKSLVSPFKQAASLKPVDVVEVQEICLQKKKPFLRFIFEIIPAAKNSGIIYSYSKVC